MLKIIRRLRFSHIDFQSKYKLIIWVVVFGVIGVILLVASSAITNVGDLGVEAENGALSGNIEPVNDDNASGGRSIQFGGKNLKYIGISDYLTGVTATQDYMNGEFIPNLGDSIRLINQHISNFGVSPKNILKYLNINETNGSFSLDIDFEASLDKRFGNNGVLRDYQDEVVLTACCHISSEYNGTINIGRDLMTDMDNDGIRTDEDLNETSPRWVNDPGNNDTNTQNYDNSETYDRQIYYKAYAEIVRRVVDKYPKIKYVQVWNEMKGYYEDDFRPIVGKSHAGAENYKKYTVFYNHVYNALKSVSRQDGSKVQVGGPYVVMRSYKDNDPNNNIWREPGLRASDDSWGYISQDHLEAVKWWNDKKDGADFITLDIKNHNRCGNPNSTNCEPEINDDPYVRMDKYTAVANWVKQNIKKSDGSNYPLWWAEWYARKNPIVQNASPDSCWHTIPLITVTTDIGGNLQCSSGSTINKAYQGSLQERAAIMSVGLIKTVKSGARTALIWGVKSNLGNGIYHPLALFNDNLEPTGANISQRCIKEHFSIGAKLYDPSNSNNNIEVLATDGSGGKWLLMTNKTNSQQFTSVFGSSYAFENYEIKCVQP